MEGSPAASGSSGYDYDAIWRDVYGDMQESGPTHRHMRRMVAELLSGLDYDSALEIGCGAGHNFPLLLAGADGDCELAGLDVSGEAMARAASSFDAELRELDIEIGSLDGRWDLVLCSLVLEHLPDDRAALRNMRGMCGRDLVLTTIAGDFDRYRAWDEQMGHVRNYRRGELEGKVTEAGFEVQRSIYWGFPFYSPLARLLQNRVRSTAEHGAATGLASRIMYWLYWLNSSRRGDRSMCWQRHKPSCSCSIAAATRSKRIAMSNTWSRRRSANAKDERWKSR